MEFELERTKQILKRTPSALNALLTGLDDEWLVNNEGPDTWSPVDVVGHLIHGEEADWIPRAKIILEHGESLAFEPFDRFAFQRRSAGKSVAALVDIFATLRARNLELLNAMELNSEQLKLCGTHPEFGRVTLAQLLATWAAHDLAHIVQISRAMAKQYDAAVGPWRKYLSVLK